MPSSIESTGRSSSAVGGDGRPLIGALSPSSAVLFLRRLRETVVNWPQVLCRLVLSSAGLSSGTLTTKVAAGPSIVTPASRPAWWPVFEMFAEDVYHLGELDDLEVGAGEVILDLGAHVGASALLLAGRWPEASLVCVEPNPGAFGYLGENLTRNGVSARLYNEAVGGSDGIATLYGSDLSSCEASTVLPQAGQSVAVPVVSFSRLIREAPGPVRLVKADCEGAENDVLAGSTAEDWRDVKAVLLEHHATKEASWPTALTRLRSLGFEVAWEMTCDWREGLRLAAFRRERPGGNGYERR